jgi:hypothetical protein
VSAAQYARYLFLTRFSKPASDREILKWVYDNRPRSIVEIGVGQAARTQRMLELLTHHVSATEIRYTGIDLFEGRDPRTPGLSLKAAFTVLRPLGVQAQWVPGDPYAALGRVANNLSNTDLLLVAADQEAESLSHAWAFVPRMLHSQSVVFQEIETPRGPAFARVTAQEVEKRAREHHRSKRRVA